MNNKKKMVARSRAMYRGIEIMETETGCAFVLDGMTFECKDLDESVAAIDAAAAAKTLHILDVNAHWVGADPLGVKK